MYYHPVRNKGAPNTDPTGTTELFFPSGCLTIQATLWSQFLRLFLSRESSLLSTP